MGDILGNDGCNTVLLVIIRDLLVIINKCFEVVPYIFLGFFYLMRVKVLSFV